MSPGIYLDRIYHYLHEILKNISTVGFSVKIQFTEFTERCQGCVATFLTNSVVQTDPE